MKSLEAIEIPIPPKNQRAAYLKFQLKERPTLGLALVLDVDGEQIKKANAVVGSVSAVPTQSEQDQSPAGRLESASRKAITRTQRKPWRKPPIRSTISKAAPTTSATLIGVFLKRAFVKALS